MPDADFYTASICGQLCLRRHGQADSPEEAMRAVKESMARAVYAAVDMAHAEGCEVEIEGGYLVAYPSVPKEPEPYVPADAIRPILDMAP